MNGGRLVYITVNGILRDILPEVVRRTELSPVARVLLLCNPVARTHEKLLDGVIIHKTTKFCQ